MKKLRNKKAEGYVDTGVKILIAVVIGALVLSGLYVLQKDVIMKNATEKVEEMFNYNGQNANDVDTPSYNTIKSSSGSGKIAQNDSTTITIEIPYDEFDYCTINGTNYVTKSGFWICEDEGYVSFIILPPVLQSLSSGKHTLRAYAKDGGFGETIFEIE